MKDEVVIIESRSAADHYCKRGEGKILADILELGGIKTQFYEVLNEQYFVEAIIKAKKDSVKYVHFSGHGLENGINLTDGTFITWEKLDNLAWPLLKDKCLVFSSCLVAKGVGKLFDFHKTFCNAIVAPTREIEWDEGLVAYSAFYHRAKKDSGPDADVKVMNHITEPGTFRYISATYRPNYKIGK